ncbi:MAG: CorA family divalent cation transporter [Sulfurimonas sp.]|jgi:magnesium transporter
MQLSFLEKPHQEDIYNGDHPSIFFQHKNYELLIYRLFSKNLNKLNVESHAYIIDNDNNIFTFNRLEEKFIKIDGYKSFYHILDKLVDKTMEEIENHVELIEELEESIYENKDAIKEWFTLKKEMVRMERLLSQAAKIHMEFIKSSDVIMHDNELLVGFEDIEEHLNRVFRFCVMNLSKLDNIYSLYTIIANENMRKTILFLTVISAIFLPINIVVGFFGINTEGLYFSGNPHATDYVALIIISILTALGVFLFIKRKSFY